MEEDRNRTRNRTRTRTTIYGEMETKDASTGVRLSTVQAKDKLTCLRVEYVYDRKTVQIVLRSIPSDVIEDKLSHNLHDVRHPNRKH